MEQYVICIDKDQPSGHYPISVSLLKIEHSKRKEIAEFHGERIEPLLLNAARRIAEEEGKA